jgi:hypothetical protein
MIAPLYDIVLVAVMVVQNPFGASQLEYQAIDYYTSWAKCYQEEKKWSRTKDQRTGYMCVKIDRN